MRGIRVAFSVAAVLCALNASAALRCVTPADVVIGVKAVLDAV